MTTKIFNPKNCVGLASQLATLGISGKAAAKAGGVAWAKGQFFGGHFELDSAGQHVMVLPVCHGEKPVDFVAFDQTHYGALYGDVFALGEDHLINPPVFGDPINVYPHPISWLQNGCDGIVILRPQDVWHQLANYEFLSCEDVAHGREIERFLKPPSPHAKILVRQSKKVAA